MLADFTMNLYVIIFVIIKINWKEKQNMNSNELYEEFLKYCKEYERDLWGIVVKKGDRCLRIKKPENPEKNNYLIYEIIEKSRISGTISDLNELLELLEDTIGEDSIVKSYYYM